MSASQPQTVKKTVSQLPTERHTTPLMSNPPDAVFKPPSSLSLAEQLTCCKSLFHNLVTNSQRRWHPQNTCPFAPDIITGSQSLREIRGQSQRWKLILRLQDFLVASPCFPWEESVGSQAVPSLRVVAQAAARCRDAVLTVCSAHLRLHGHPDGRPTRG